MALPPGYIFIGGDYAHKPPGFNGYYSAIAGGWVGYYGSAPGVQPPTPPGNGDTGGGGGSSGGQKGPDTIILPTVTNQWSPDLSMEKRLVDTDVGSARFFWPAFPYGTFGISGQVMDTHTQIQDFMPTDPRLCSVNYSPQNTDCNTLVYDLYPDGRWNDNRGAQLNSLCRVVVKPRGILSLGGLAPGQTGTQQGNNKNSLSLNVGLSGTGEVLGGFFNDGFYGGGATRFARWSVRDGGFLDPGAARDKHKLGYDYDGNPINASHISILSFFTNGTDKDGPLYFEDAQPKLPETTIGNYYTRVHMYFDTTQQYSWPRDKPQVSSAGMWKWYTNVFFQVTTPSTPGPPGPPRPPDPRPPGLPPRPPGQPGGGGPPIGDFGAEIGIGQPNNFVGITAPGPEFPSWVVEGQEHPGGLTNSAISRIMKGSSSWMQDRGIVVSTAETAFSSIVVRPQRYVHGEADLRISQGWGDIDAMNRHEATTPLTMRMSGWGGQGNTRGGPYLDPVTTGVNVSSDRFVYTQRPGQSRSKTGTGPGGQLIMPPEVDITDIDDAFAPQGVTTSATYFAVSRGAWFGSGTPDLATGGLNSGFSWGAPTGGASSQLQFYSHSSLGVRAPVLTMTSSAVIVNSGMTFSAVGSIASSTSSVSAATSVSAGTDISAGGSITATTSVTGATVIGTTSVTSPILNASSNQIALTISNDTPTSVLDVGSVTLTQLANFVAQLARGLHTIQITVVS